MAIQGLQCANLAVGSKQTRLAVEKGRAEKVFVAQDADPKLIQPIVNQCRVRGVPLVMVASMRELGKACGIQVGAAAATMVRR